MAAIPVRELRNHTAEVLRRVEAGEEIEVFKDNRPVAKIIPLSRRRQWLPASEIGRELVRLGPDTTGLSEELRATLTRDDGRSTFGDPPTGVGRYVRLYRP
jgi:prevent-host-death family protein